MLPDESARPFVDFEQVIREMEPDQQKRVIGKAAWRLVESGTVEYGDVVTKARVRTFREVVSLKKLSVDRLVRAGISEVEARKAYDATHTLMHQATATQRRQLVEQLAGRGVGRDEIRQGVGSRVAARVGISGPSGPGRIGPPTPPPPKPGDPILPGRPIAERLAAWTEGDAIVDRMKVLNVALREASDEMRRTERGLLEFRSGLSPAGRRLKSNRDKVKRLEAAATAARERHQAELARKKSEARRELAEVIGVKVPSPIKGDKFAVGNWDLRQEIDKAEDFLRTILGGQGSGAPVDFAYHQMEAGSRANAGGTRVRLSPTNAARTVLHEIGHVLEDQLRSATGRQVGDVGREFLDHRAGNEPLKSLAGLFPTAGYDPGERGRRDRFDRFFSEIESWYVGKEYQKRSEIISMGLEALYNDPAGFASLDPEYAKFMVGILRGELR